MQTAELCVYCVMWPDVIGEGEEVAVFVCGAKDTR